MMKENNFEKPAQVALEKCLEKVPFLIIERVQYGDGCSSPDLIVKVRIQNEVRLLIVKFNNNGQPRYARLAIYQLKELLREKPNAYAIFMAPYISAETGKICAENGIGFLDLAGNCLISFATVYIHQSGNKNPEIQRRNLRSLYSPKGERILRVLLDQPKETWTLVKLSQAAQVSLGQVANIKKLLLDREWLRVEDKGIRLINYSELLEEWSKSYNFQRNQTIECYAMAETPEIEAQIGQTCKRIGLRYALTSFSSAARIAPKVRYQKAYAYINNEPRPLLDDLGWKVVSSGSNVSLSIPYDEGVFLGELEVDSINIVSPVQTYLDLQNAHGRGQEAAEAIWSIIEKTW